MRIFYFTISSCSYLGHENKRVNAEEAENATVPRMDALKHIPDRMGKESDAATVKNNMILVT